MLGTYYDIYEVDANMGEREVFVHDGNYFKQCLAVTGDGQYVVWDSYYAGGVRGKSKADATIFTITNPGSWSHTGVGS